MTKLYPVIKMDADLYDEFGNYIGPDLESDDEEEDEDVISREHEAQDYDVSLIFIPTSLNSNFGK